MSNAIVVFTAKSIEHMLQDGGTQSWVLDKSNAKHSEYVVCCRSGLDEVEGPEPKGSAFLIGRVSDVVPSTESPGRWLIGMSEFARVSLPDLAGLAESGQVHRPDRVGYRSGCARLPAHAGTLS